MSTATKSELRLGVADHDTPLTSEEFSTAIFDEPLKGIV